MSKQKFETKSELETSYSKALNLFITGVNSFRPALELAAVTPEANSALSKSLSQVKKSAQAVMDLHDGELSKELFEFTTQYNAESSIMSSTKQNIFRAFLLGRPQFSTELQSKKSSYIENHQKNMERRLSQLTVLHNSITTLLDACADNSTDHFMTNFTYHWLLKENFCLQRDITRLESVMKRNADHISKGDATISGFENLVGNICPYKL